MGHRAKITITREGNALTVTDGRRTRLSSCASAAAAKSFASRMNNDLVFAAKWMNFNDPVQLALQFDAGPGVAIRPATDHRGKATVR